VALLHVSTADGAQNNTIQNNTITLNRSYANTFGIYSNNRHSPAQRLVRAGAQKANSYQSPQTLKP